MNEGFGPSRREFLGSAALFVAVPNGGFQQVDTGGLPNDDYEFQGVADLMGPRDARPASESEFFDNKKFYAYQYYALDEGGRYFKRQSDAEWTKLPFKLPDYPNGSLPGDPANASMYFDNNRGTPAWFDRDHYEFPNFTDDVLTEPVSVTGSARVPVWDAPINEGSMLAGRAYQADLMGDFTTGNSSAFFTVYAVYGGVELAGISSTAENVTEAPWSIEFTYTIRTDGADGTGIAHTRGLFNGTPDDSDSEEFTIDTTVGNNISFEIAFNDDDASNEVHLEQAHIKQMG